MIGLAVGIDYSLLIVSRFREELSRGLAKYEAVAKAGDTAGRTVLFSGTTVVLALIGMLIVPVSFFQSLGLGAILVVIAALAASLTLLPALLALLGPRVDFLSIPFLARFSLRSPQTAEHGFWVTITHAVTRYPIVSIILVAVPMIVGGVLLLRHPNRTERCQHFPRQFGDQGGVHRLRRGVLRRRSQSRRGTESRGDRHRWRYQQSRGAAGDGTSRDVHSRRSRFPVPPSQEVNPNGDLALLTLPFPGEPNSRAATEKMATLREVHVAEAFEGVPAEVYVGGRNR